MQNNPPSYITSPRGYKLAYHHTQPAQPAVPYTVVFLGGFRSDMSGSKATYLEAFCMRHHLPFLRMDYSGHGESGGEFLDGSIGQWKDDVLHVLNHVVRGDVLLIGSSMGGWLMLLAALALQPRVVGLLGIASAPDFTEDLIWDALKPHEQKIIWEHGVYNLPNEYCDPQQGDNDYPITRILIEDGRTHLLLRNTIPLTCPVRLVHGMQDKDVPYQVALTLMQKLGASQVNLHLAKEGDHRMSTPAMLECITQELQQLMQHIAEKHAMVKHA